MATRLSLRMLAGKASARCRIGQPTGPLGRVEAGTPFPLQEQTKVNRESTFLFGLEP